MYLVRLRVTRLRVRARVRVRVRVKARVGVRVRVRARVRVRVRARAKVSEQLVQPRAEEHEGRAEGGRHERLVGLGSGSGSGLGSRVGSVVRVGVGGSPRAPSRPKQSPTRPPGVRASKIEVR